MSVCFCVQALFYRGFAKPIRACIKPFCYKGFMKPLRLWRTLQKRLYEAPRDFATPLSLWGLLKHLEICRNKDQNVCMYVCRDPLLYGDFVKPLGALQNPFHAEDLQVLLYRDLLKLLWALQNPISIGTLWRTPLPVGKRLKCMYICLYEATVQGFCKAPSLY